MLDALQKSENDELTYKCCLLLLEQDNDGEVVLNKEQSSLDFDFSKLGEATMDSLEKILKEQFH